jgi:hypothetical protein
MLTDDGRLVAHGRHLVEGTRHRERRGLTTETPQGPPAGVARP